MNIVATFQSPEMDPRIEFAPLYRNVTTVMKIPLWRLRTLRRQLWEAFGSVRYSIPCSESIHSGLSKYFSEPGFFIEAGAVDGYFESNTYFLERFQSWTGILIEPVPDMYQRLRTNRPTSIHYNCALVAPDYQQPSVAMTSAHAMSTIAPDIRSSERTIVEVPGRTLASIVDVVAPERIDLLSLDWKAMKSRSCRA